jgi:hypothetical protein
LSQANTKAQPVIINKIKVGKSEKKDKKDKKDKKTGSVIKKKDTETRARKEKKVESTEESEESEDWDRTKSLAQGDRLTLAVLSDGNLISILDKYSIVDVCGFDNSIYVILNEGDILKMVHSNDDQPLENRDYTLTRIKNNVILSRIVNFGGYLYGLSEGKLYLLDSRTYSGLVWNWKHVSWAPKQIESIDTTLVGDYIWMTTGGKGYLYTLSNASHVEPVLAEKVTIGSKRRSYGVDPKTYLEIDPKSKTCIKYPSKEKTTSIVDGVLTYDGDIVRIPPGMSDQITAIRIVNWEPLYIVRTD